ncbi:MAG: diaminopimelate epimerase [Planctomycetota bacterium]|jgi:diaminopimelate epimerase
MRFTKMHGCGNDYVYIDAWQERLPADLAALARLVSDRHRGIGADGLIVVAPDGEADARMIMFNADGSESEMCGNGLRCAAKLAWDHGHLTTPNATFATGAGLRAVSCQLDSQGQCLAVRVDMGAPILQPRLIPVSTPTGKPPRLHLTIAGEDLELLCVGMGNPHAVIFVDDADAYPVTSLGPQLETHSAFPNRSNIEFVHRLADEDGVPVLRQRTWERGSGETEACGTGACAVAVAAILSGRLAPGPVIVRLNGGDLRINWPGHGSVHMSGEAVAIFSGDWQH